MDDDWPFSEPRRVAVITLRQILEGAAPILLATHDEEDGGWQFLADGDPAPEDARVVALEEIHARDPTVAQLADLPPGWKAWRSGGGEPWLRCQVLERHESPDELLVLEVTRDERVGLTISLHPGWHSHPEIIATHRGQDDEVAAARQFIDEILSSTMPIAVHWKAGHAAEVSPVWWETMDEVLADAHLEADEAITFRRWDGAEVVTPGRGSS